MHPTGRYVQQQAPSGPRRRRRRARGLFAAAAIVVGALALPASPAFGEGSVDLNTGPDASVRQGMSAANFPGALVGATRLWVYAQAGETVQLASSAMGVGQGNALLYAPGSTSPIWDCAVDDPGTGQIATGAAGRAQELAGPEPTAGDANPNTYRACEYVVPAGGDGIYRVAMVPVEGTRNVGTGTVANPVQAAGANIAIWDITVRSGGGAVQPGRAFSYQYVLATSGQGSSGVEVFVQTPTGYEYQVNLYDQGGANWTLNADDVGVIDRATGERLFASFACGPDNGTNRGCIHSEAALGPPSGYYPLFLNSVDPIAVSGTGGLAETRAYSRTPISPASNPLTNTFTGAGGQSAATNYGSGGTFAVTSPPQMADLDYTLEIDANRNGTFGDAPDVVDRGVLEADGSTSFTWNGLNAAGTAPACGAYPYRIRSTLAEVHLAMLDVEFSGGTRIERLTLPGDPALGNPLWASYNDHDPFKNGYVVTTADPPAVTDGISGPGFHAWGPDRFGIGSGNEDYIDTWTRLPEVSTTGTLRVLCADLAIAKTASQNPAFPDQDISYDLVVRNNGPDTAQNVVVTDPLPGNLTYVSSSAGCTLGGTTVTCRLGSLAAGASHTFRVTARVAASATGTLSNTATTRSDTHDPNESNNRDPEDVPIEPLADVAIAKRALSNRLVPGRQLEYELVVTNHGPSVARDVRMRDPLPRGLSFVSASRGCTFADGTVTCTEASLASGRSVTYRVVTRVAANVREDSVTNTATVESTTRDPDRSNNEDRERVPSGPQADVSITKTPSVERVAVGGQLFYTVVIRNAGPSDAQNVVVADEAGAGLTLLEARGSQGVSCATTASRVTCRLRTLAEGGTAQVLVSARADRAGELTNSATVDSTTEDPDRRNNRDERRVTGEPGPVPQPADLEIVKTSNRRAVRGAQTIAYTLRVRNLGPGTATGVQVIDTPSLPIKIRSVRSSVGRCTTTVPIRCDLGTLRAGSRATIRVVAQPKAPGTLRNSASVTGDVPDPRAENNIDGTATKVLGLLRIRKVASTRTIRAGGTLSYRITVTNASPFALRSVRVCDDLPSGLVFVSSTPKARLVRGRHCWTIRTLGARGSKTFTVRAKALRGTSGRKVNTATATAPGARGARSRSAADSAPVQVIAGRTRAGGVTG